MKPQVARSNAEQATAKVPSFEEGRVTSEEGVTLSRGK